MSDGLPNLLIAGFPKAGTGSLFSYLAQHPSICPSTEKEIGYFSPLLSGATPPSVDTYRSYFSHCTGERYRMEATPNYCLGRGRIPQAIKSSLDKPRIVMILRDPVDRLWSAYTFQRSLGKLTGIESFEDHIAACQDQRREGHDIIPKSAFNGLSIGMYGDYLDDWFREFASDMKVVFFDDLASQPHSVVADLSRWLGIDSDVTTSFDYKVHNKTVHPRSPAMAEAMFGAKKVAGTLLQRSPTSVRKAARKAYFSMNSGKPKELLQPKTEHELTELYRESNKATTALLQSHGYDQLPGWLSST